MTGVGAGTVAGATHAPPSGNFRAHLRGDEEVPPVETKAQGQAIVSFDDDISALSYKLIVANIEDVVAAHIHCAPEGVNGPVGVTLFEGGPVSKSGVLAEGTVTEPDAGNGCGWESLEDVFDAIERGEAYVNVHTLANLPGEIRGQLH
ncbi:CHRD domain-containing protein [Haloferax sp. S1W]|uniref:CHRD domain-containing protein n=1 Tax=Haloferax sp. S1W TaxID=3377110 RepID=UPI0037C5E9B7